MNILYERVGDFPSRSAIFIEQTRDIGYAIDTMQLHSVRHLLITSAELKLTGIVSIMDIMRLMFQEANVDFLKIPIAEIMSRRPFTINGDETVKDATLLIRNLGVSGIPVISDNGEMQGYFSMKDIIGHIMDKVWVNIEDERINFDDNNIGSLITDTEIITDDFSIWQASDSFIQSKRRQLIVTSGEKNKYKGLLTPSALFSTLIPSFERKFQKNLLQDRTLNSFPIEYNTFTTTSNSLLHIRREMSTHGLDALPIISRQKVVKIISEKDLAGFLALKI